MFDTTKYSVSQQFSLQIVPTFHRTLPFQPPRNKSEKDKPAKSYKKSTEAKEIVAKPNGTPHDNVSTTNSEALMQTLSNSTATGSGSSSVKNGGIPERIETVGSSLLNNVTWYNKNCVLSHRIVPPRIKPNRLSYQNQNPRNRQHESRAEMLAIKNLLPCRKLVLPTVLHISTKLIAKMSLIQLMWTIWWVILARSLFRKIPSVWWGFSFSTNLFWERWTFF